LLRAASGARHDPLLPEYERRNFDIQTHLDVQAMFWSSRHIPFVDLFTPMKKAFQEAKRPLTLNGVFLTEEGDHVLASILVDALCGPAKPDAPSLTPAQHATLRAAVLEKDLFWFNRYQTTDGYNVYGGRSALAST